MSANIQIIGEINWDSYALFSERLAELEGEKSQTIHIELASDGGDANAALAFYGRIRTSPKHTRITVYGCASSAATLVLAAGGHRIMHEDSWFMLHDDGIYFKMNQHNKATILTEAQQAETIEIQWAQILARHSKKPWEYWRELSRQTTYITPDNLLELGLIDEVLRG